MYYPPGITYLPGFWDAPQPYVNYSSPGRNSHEGFGHASQGIPVSNAEPHDHRNGYYQGSTSYHRPSLVEPVELDGTSPSSEEASIRVPHRPMRSQDPIPTFHSTNINRFPKSPKHRESTTSPTPPPRSRGPYAYDLYNQILIVQNELRHLKLQQDQLIARLLPLPDSAKLDPVDDPGAVPPLKELAKKRTSRAQEKAIKVAASSRANDAEAQQEQVTEAGQLNEESPERCTLGKPEFRRLLTEEDDDKENQICSGHRDEPGADRCNIPGSPYP